MENQGGEPQGPGPSTSTTTFSNSSNSNLNWTPKLSIDQRPTKNSIVNTISRNNFNVFQYFIKIGDVPKKFIKYPHLNSITGFLIENVCRIWNLANNENCSPWFDTPIQNFDWFFSTAIVLYHGICYILEAENPIKIKKSCEAHFVTPVESGRTPIFLKTSW
jgi:hypothetical protein